MSIKYTAKVKFNLIFDFKVHGVVEESDVVGALLALSSSIHSSFSITYLQHLGKVGKIEIQNVRQTDSVNGKAGSTTGVIIVPCDMSSSEASLLATFVEESVRKVKLFECKINLNSVDNVDKLNMSKILKRAIEVKKTYFGTSDSMLSSADLVSKMESALQKRTLTKGNFVLGSTFYESSNIIVVEGRADVNKLSSCGINHVLALGGHHFDPDQASQLLKDKTVTVFLDSDVGGFENLKKLSKVVHIKYRIDPPKGRSVEDLTDKQIFEAIKNRTLFE